MGAMSVLQAVIATILIFVLAFGVGFILNMLLKTTWFPVFLYAATVVGLGVYWAWGPGRCWRTCSNIRLRIIRRSSADWRAPC